MKSAIITVGRRYRFHRLCKDADQQWRDRLGGVYEVVAFADNLTSLAQDVVLRGDGGDWLVCSPYKFALAFVPLPVEATTEPHKVAGYVSTSIHG